MVSEKCPYVGRQDSQELMATLHLRREADALNRSSLVNGKPCVGFRGSKASEGIQKRNVNHVTVEGIRTHACFLTTLYGLSRADNGAMVSSAGLGAQIGTRRRQVEAPKDTLFNGRPI